MIRLFLSRAWREETGFRLALYLSVGLLARGVTGAEIAAVLEARRGISGLVEKAGRSDS